MIMAFGIGILRIGLVSAISCLFLFCGGGSIQKAGEVTENIMATENEAYTDVILEAAARREGDKLIVEYTVRNNTQHDIYLFDQMISYGGNKQIIDPNKADSFFDEPKTLRLVRGILQLPGEKDVKVYVKPYVRSGPGRDEAKGRIELPVPVPEMSTFYGLPDPENSKTVDCEKIRLLIGWVEFRNGMKIDEDDVSGQKVLRVSGSWDKPYQRLLEKTLTVKVSVVVRTDTFDRQMPLQ